ncbi:hypothetical protein LWI28_003543 [Acer negundo]|uniref:RRM domain-containing protein n=1 Tax=Acer negundo TaxID=4023 RepID=A0AAD5JC28_ACENE|nr:hypothetical protein LWI28_003543 [Acer negundo]
MMWRRENLMKVEKHRERRTETQIHLIACLLAVMSYSKRSRYSRSPSPYGRSPSPYGRYGRSVSRSRSVSRRSRSPSVENPGNNLYVTGLSPRITKKELEKHFSSEGKVVDVHLVVDPWTRESRGFGFVTMASVEEADRCIKNLDRSVIEGRVIMVEKARRRRGRTPTPGRYLGLRTIHVRRRSPSYSPSRRADLTLLTIVGGGLTLLILSGDPIHPIMDGTDHTLDLVPLTVGLQMTATIEGVTVPTLLMTRGMMIATIEGGIEPTLHMTLPMIVTIEETDIAQFHEVPHHHEGAIGGAILAVSPPSEGEAQGEAIHAAFLPGQGAQGGATHRAYPQDQGKVSPMEVRPSRSRKTAGRVILGVHLGARVQVPDQSLDL